MLTPLADRAWLANWLQQDAGRYLYELGDLDLFFWPHTRWWGWSEAGKVKALALCYTGDPTPVLLLNSPSPAARALLQALLDPLTGPLNLPCYAHLAPGLPACLPAGRHADGGEDYLRMVLQPGPLRRMPQPSGLDVRVLSPDDAAVTQAFLQAHYPGNWFNPRMLASGAYLGLFTAQQALVAVAGVHVYSPHYRVAALGNIAVHTDRRGQGLGLFLTGALCQHLQQQGIEQMGLNVALANQAAQRVYRAAGFAEHTRYQECLLTAV